MYVWLNHFALHLKVTQHCKSTILQKKKKRHGPLPQKIYNHQPKYIISLRGETLFTQNTTFATCKTSSICWNPHNGLFLGSPWDRG